MAKTTKTTQNTGKPSWMKNAATAVKFSAAELFSEKVPFVTNTARNAIDNTRELASWVKQNNPFRATSGSKDPLIRQIQNSAKRGLKAAKQDLSEGNLRFEKLNKEFSSFVGDDEFGFDFDFGFGEDDSGFEDWDTEDTGNSNASFGDNLNEDYFQLTAAATTTTVSAIGESTSQVATAIFSSSEASTNKLIAANMTNFVKLSGQISSMQNTITTIDKNIAQIVLSFNEQTQFFSQAQVFMEHQEQTLNDIKAILAEQLEFSRGGRENDYYGNRSNTPAFLENGFNLKEYVKYIFDESVPGTILGAGLATLFKALKIDKPGILKNHDALPISSLFNLGGAMEKFFPSIKKISELDNILKTGAETFFEKMDDGELGGIFNVLGMLGFGVPRPRSGRLDLSNYNKGATQWTGKSERAIQEVIPNYLSRMEVHLQRIADAVDGDMGYEDVRGRMSLYNYDTGSFESVAQMVKRAQQTIDSTVQLSFSQTFDMLDKFLVNTEDMQDKVSNLIKEIMKNEREGISKDQYKMLRDIIDDPRNEAITEEQANKIYHQLELDKKEAVKNVGDVRRRGSDRSEYFYNIADEVNAMRAGAVQFLPSKSRNDILKNKPKELLSESELDELRKIEREEQLKKATEGFIGKIKDTGLYKAYLDLKEKGGPINQAIGNFADKASNEIIKKLYNISDLSEEYTEKAKLGRENRRELDNFLSLRQLLDQVDSYTDQRLNFSLYQNDEDQHSYDIGSYSVYPETGRLPNNQRANVHEGEIILTPDQSQSFSDLIESVNQSRGLKSKVSAVKDFVKGKFIKFKRRDPVTQEEAEFIDDLTNPEIERATTDEDQQREIQREMSDNIRTIASVMVSESNERSHAKHKSGIEKILEALFGERDENGFFTGDNAEIGNWFIDTKNYIKHLFNGKGYLKSSGETVDDSEESVKSTFGAFKDATVDQAMKTIYGEDSEKYKNFKGRKLRPKNNIGDAATPDGQMDLLNPDLVDQANESIFGGNDPSQVRDQINRVADVQNTTGDKIRRGLIGGISGALITTGLTPSFGLLPKLLLPGGPIGGALLGVGASLLSRNDYFMDMMFGEEQDGERVGGIISKDIQDTFKKHKGALLLGSTLGAGVGLAVPQAVGASLGIFGKLLLGSGPIGGAVLGIGTSLLLNSEKVRTALFGDEQDQKNMSTFIRDQKEKIKGFMSEHKDKLLGIGIGGGVGALAGASLASSLGFGAVPLILLSSTLGVATGLASTTNKFKDFFLGTRTDQIDDKGNPVRNGDGLLGRIGRMFELEVIRPVKDFSSTAADKFIEWVRYDIVDQYKAIGENLNDSIAKAFNINMDAITDAIKKPLTALASIPTKIMGLLVKGTLGSVGMAAKIAGGVISAPGKIIRGISDRVTGKNQDRRDTMKDFRKQARASLFDRTKDDQGNSAYSRTKERLERRRQLAVAKVEAEGGGKFAQLGASLKARATNFKELHQADLSTLPILSSVFNSSGNSLMDKERIKYAKANQLEDKRWFMKDVERGRHKAKFRDINADAKTRSKATKLASKWASADGYNDTITLSPKELAKRNKELKKLYGKDFKTLNNTEMLEFIYDPEGKKKKKKEDKEAKTEQSQQATIDTRDAVNETRDALTNEKSSFWQNMTNTLSGVFGKFFKKDEENKEATPDVDENATGDQTTDNDNNQENQDTEIADLIDENNAADSGKAMQETNTKPKNGAETSDDRDVDKNENATVDISQESIEDLNNDSPSKGIFDNLFSKKGLITTVVAAVGIPALIKFFPKIIEGLPNFIDWVKDTAAPWVIDTMFPAIINIGTATAGILEYLVNPGGKISEAKHGDEKSNKQSDYQKEAGLDASAVLYDSLTGTQNYNFLTGAGEGGGIGSIAEALGIDEKRKDVLFAGKNSVDLNNNGFKGGPTDWAIFDKEYALNENDIARLWMMYAASTARVKMVNKLKDPNAKVTVEDMTAFMTENESVGKNFMQEFVVANKDHVTNKLATLSNPDKLFEIVSAVIEHADQSTIDHALSYANKTEISSEIIDRANDYSIVRSGGDGRTSVGRGIGYGHFMQTDPRWGGRRFAAIGNGGYTTMANGGCGPTTLANVAYQMGINTSPDRVASMAVRNGYTADGGSNARLFNEGVSRLGLRSRPIGKGAIANALSRGSKIILAGKGTGNGIYTNAGHIISARGLDSRGNAIVDDPLRKNPLRVPVNKLTKGLTNAWSIGRGPDKGVNKASTSIDNIAEYESTKHIYDDIYNTSSIHTTNIADYQRIMGESKIKEQRLKDAEKYKEYYDASVAERNRDLTWYDNGQFGVYHQWGIDKWSNKPLGNGSYSGNIANGGCVISSMGTILSYLTGLNFNPLFYTEKLGAYDSKGLNGNLSVILEKASAPFTSLTPHVINPYDESYLKNSEFMSAINSGYPVVVYNTGGTTGSAFIRPSDGHPYYTHAMVFKPNSGDPSKGKLYDPGSLQSVNNAREFNTQEFFSNQQGIDRVYYYSGTMPTLDEKYAAAAYYSGQLSLNDAISWGSKGSNPKYSIDGSDIHSSEIAESYGTTKLTVPSTSSTEQSADSGDGNMLTKIIAKLGELSGIFSNVLVSLFGGKYESYYNNASSSNSSTSTSGTSYTATNTSQTESTPVPVTDYSSDSEVASFASLPDWSKQGVLVNGTASLPTSKKLSADQVSSILQATIKYISKHEAGGDYTSAVVDTNLLPAIGIGGFNGLNAAEIFARIKNSGQITDPEKLSELDNAIVESQQQHATAWQKLPGLSKVLQDSGDLAKNAEDAYLSQLQMSGLKYPLQMYDEGVFNDPRSIIMLSQFAGFGPDHLRRMMDTSYSKYASVANTYKTYFADKTFNDDELTNTVMVMNDYYSKYTSGSYIQGHKDRFKSIYQDLGGENTASLGFGAGVSDSLNTSSYDIVDTPYALNEPQEVKMDVKPVTSRIDVLIELLKKIYTTVSHPVTVNNPATTSGQNIGQGKDALTYSRKLSEAGKNTEHVMPMFEKENANARDKLRLIHNRIAKSPRTV